ncbi:MAG: hypothetical protein JWR84_181 [Caulobacter sp.]|nr:hypothetical protein [Caulobacter sp.]
MEELRRPYTPWMSTIFAGDVAPTFLLDGSHAARGVIERSRVGRALSQQLILHDRVVIPLEDFTVIGSMAELLGAPALSKLLEQGRVRFVRTVGTLVFGQGTANDGGLVVIQGQENRTAAHAKIEMAIEHGIRPLNLDRPSQQRLAHAVTEATEEIETAELVRPVFEKTMGQFRQSAMWRAEYQHSKSDLLVLPGLQPMQMKVYNAGTPPSRSPVDTVLALARGNLELHLAGRVGADAMSTSCPIADGATLAIKANQLQVQGLEHLVTTVQVPDLTNLIDANEDNAGRFVDLIASRQAADFREWFHQQDVVRPEEYAVRYLDIVHAVGPLESLPSQIGRFAVFKILGAIPIIGPVFDVFDTFVLPRLLEGRSPKFFVANLRNFAGAVRAN